MAKDKAKAQRINRTYIIFERQDQALQELADQSPGLDKSAVLRIVVDLGLAQLKRSEAAQRLIRCESIEDLLVEAA
jgi:hypothetical protein